MLYPPAGRGRPGRARQLRKNLVGWNAAGTRCPMARLRTLFCVVKQAAVAWNENHAPTMGAALAYYTVFSLAPVLLIAISIASLIDGEDAARSGIVTEIRKTLGPATADALAALLTHSY